VCWAVTNNVIHLSQEDLGSAAETLFRCPSFARQAQDLGSSALPTIYLTHSTLERVARIQRGEGSVFSDSISVAYDDPMHARDHTIF
jgi:hypothetical protein